jgi:hypothetical protein
MFIIDLIIWRAVITKIVSIKRYYSKNTGHTAPNEAVELIGSNEFLSKTTFFTMFAMLRNSLWYKELRSIAAFLLQKGSLVNPPKLDFSDSLNRSVYAAGAVAPLASTTARSFRAPA